MDDAGSLVWLAFVRLSCVDLHQIFFLLADLNSPIVEASAGGDDNVDPNLLGPLESMVGFLFSFSFLAPPFRTVSVFSVGL
jgi:hypothetical protein